MRVTAKKLLTFSEKCGLLGAVKAGNGTQYRLFRSIREPPDGARRCTESSGKYPREPQPEPTETVGREAACARYCAEVSAQDTVRPFAVRRRRS